ncbi:MAG TPA: peptidoglycan editing factor PgeF [Bryobacteraceae bacterium]|nr:peptidoglycan editing factor PgeF [Bryobacteraceae bacterium]
MRLYRDGNGTYRAESLDGLDWLQHGFGTRDSQNWPPGPAAIVKQIHSNLCILSHGETGVLGHADALATATPGVWLAIRTADCVPVLIVDERLRAVTAVHAGWRGTAANIAGAAVQKLAAEFGSKPEDLIAAIGPAICGKCYQVSAEVATQFQGWFPERTDLDRQTRIDLPETNRRQLVAAGVEPDRIAIGAPCTLEHAGEFYSYRRAPEERGRMVAAIRVAPGDAQARTA